MGFVYVPASGTNRKKDKRIRIQSTLNDVTILTLLGMYRRKHTAQARGDKYSKKERAIWWLFSAIVFGVTLFGCYQLVTAFVNSPIVVSVELMDDALIGDDFPAVTVCNIRKWLAKGRQKSTLVEQRDHIRNRRNRAMPHCSWHNQATLCDQLFDMTLTDWETYCYSFNYGYPEKYTPSELFLSADNNGSGAATRQKPIMEDNEGETNASTQFKVVGLGLHNGLSAIFDILRRENGYYEPDGLVTVKRESLGLMVLVHHRKEFPLMSFKSLHIAPGFENNIQVRINKIITTEDVFTHPVANRKKKCYRAGERKLFYFEEYSASACRQECILNQTIAECGCRHWTATGLPDDQVCYTDVEVRCYNEMADKLNNEEKAAVYSKWKLCQCLPLCEYISYDFSINHAIIDAESVALRFNKTVEYARYNMAIANVYFGDSKITVYRRNVLTTIAKLCSNIGGIIGSVVGWSLLSAGKIIFEAARGFVRRQDSAKDQRSPRPTRTNRKNGGTTNHLWMTTDRLSNNNELF